MKRAPNRGRSTLDIRLFATALVAAGCTAFSATAGTFSVTPVRIFMTPKDRAVAVTVNNEGDEELVMQADVYRWKQKADGTDDLELSEDLILSPPILKIPAKARQVVRLARVAPPDGAQQQQTYRMIIREIPEARAADKKVQLQVALAFSLPVFITPPGAKRDVACTVARTAPDAATANCANRGTAYAQPRDITLTGASGEKLAAAEGGGYILPGTTRSFPMKSGAGALRAGPAKLAMSFDDGTAQAFDVTVGD